jgi:hypothetical protein
MTASQRIVTFQGVVRCRHAPWGPGMTLTGLAQGGEEVSVAFSTSAPADLPPVLQDVAVDRIEPDQYRLGTAARDWIIPARVAHVHREIAADFYRTIRPRVPPWNKWLLWRAIVVVAASPLGFRLLSRLRN